MPKKKATQKDTSPSKVRNLVIVESPTKTKSLGKYLGSDYIVLSSKGHIIDLPKSKLGVDTENNYKPDYLPIHGKGTIIKELKKTAKDAKTVYLATDLDREGEAISWHIASALGALNDEGHLTNEAHKRFKRVVFHEITKDAVLEAFNHPRELNYGLIDAYQARRVLDRLVGYKLSPLLWRKIQYGLSAGRVQSVALRLLVEREKERESFTSTTFYRFTSTTAKNNRSLTAELTHIDNKPIESKETITLFAGSYTYTQTSVASVERKRELEQLFAKLTQLKVTETRLTTSNKKPQPPFTTATMQRTATTRLSISPSQTMRLAQQLYEEGHITYHRTDSTFLSEQFVNAARTHIESMYGTKYLPEAANEFKTKSKSAQEAHEAIRPTDISDIAATKSTIKKTLDGKAAALYEMIANRAVSSQMTPATYQNNSIVLESLKSEAEEQYRFTAKGSKLIFDGYLKVWGRNSDDVDLPEVTEGDLLEVTKIEATAHQTSPPPRYSEASLIKALEEHGIGRPSTYAPTIETIQRRNYAIKENGSLYPTDTGRAVSTLLTDHFEEIVDLNFTAEMEDKFDEIANHQLKWQDVIDEFYRPFIKKVESKDEELERKDYKIIKELDEKCPECGHNLQLKLGRYGKFYSCSNFPDCEYAKPFVEYIGMKCEECSDGDIIIRHTRFGKAFFGCTNYPECEWASWTDPRSERYNAAEERERRLARKARAEKKAKKVAEERESEKVEKNEKRGKRSVKKKDKK